MPIATKIAGNVRQIKSPSVRIAGSWRSISDGWENVDGVWVPFFKNQIVIENNNVVANYNLFIEAGSPSEPVNILFINNGTIYATSTATAALTIPANFKPGSTFTIINTGNIYGKGGAGGAGGTQSGTFAAQNLVANAGVAGSPGGPAIRAYHDFSIDNAAGWIYGGGGGGGGGGAVRLSQGGCSNVTSGRNGGAGGAGASYGAAAESGGNPANLVHEITAGNFCQNSFTITLNPGNGGNGGNFGTAGGTGVAGAFNQSPSTGAIGGEIVTGGSRPGGAAGAAIKLENGANVTWIAGSGRRSGAVA